MPDYHILKKSLDNRYADVYVHLPVPATQTTAGMQIPDPTLTYQRALKESLIGQKVTGMVVLETQWPVEYAELVDGQKVEVFNQFRFSSKDLTDAQRRAEIENGNDNEIGVIQMKLDIATPGSDLWDKILDPLEWWGYYRDL